MNLNGKEKPQKLQKRSERFFFLYWLLKKKKYPVKCVNGGKTLIYANLWAKLGFVFGGIEFK
jgi:hypothetical protein